jgi:hypothetical protein
LALSDLSPGKVCLPLMAGAGRMRAFPLQIETIVLLKKINIARKQHMPRMDTAPFP